ncbi:MAG TPA: hypothetical protein VI299_04790, partial [Polyangiales bacterium]
KIASADLSKQGLPRTIGLLHDSGPLGPVDIKVTGLHATMQMVEKELVTAFAEGETTELHVILERACLNKICGAGETCMAGMCGAIPVLKAGEEPDAGPRDGGSRDSGPGPSEAGTDGSTDSGSAGAGNKPTCAITLPADGDTYQSGHAVKLQGKCMDVESGVLTAGLTWTSDQNGSSIGNGASATTMALTKLGSHSITLCAPDPADATVQGCASTTIKIASTPQPAVSIGSMAQGQKTTSPFVASAGAITFTSTATGAGIRVEWKDSIQGVFGTGADGTLANPQIGKHHVTLTVTDRDGATATDERDFIVLATVNQSSLVDVLSSIGDAVSANASTMDDDILSIASYSTYGFAGTRAGQIYRWSLTMPSEAATSVGTGAAPIQDLALDAGGKLYAATSGEGVLSCAPNGGGSSDYTCASIKDGDLPSNDTLSLGLGTRNNTAYLLVGTASGMLPADPSAPNTALNGTTAVLDGRGSGSAAEIRRIGVGESTVYLATGAGLYRYNPTGMSAFVNDGAPSLNMTSVIVASDGTVWVGTGNQGIGHYDRNADPRWTVWDSNAGLPSNQVHALALSRASLGGQTRDVLWIGTSAGLVRFDPRVGGFTTFTTADGLPSNDVLSLTVAADGSKLIGTDVGVGRYVGP